MFSDTVRCISLFSLIHYLPDENVIEDSLDEPPSSEEMPGSDNQVDETPSSNMQVNQAPSAPMAWESPLHDNNDGTLILISCCVIQVTDE